ncbi:MAG: trehalase family glycosidase [Bacilli bacterium]
MPYWNFVDWSKGWWSGYAPEGENDSPTVNSLHLAYTLRQASELMNHYGYAAEAEAYRAEYDKLVKAVKKVAWDENRKMFADYAGAKTFSQHPNIMAILSDAIPASEQKRLFEKIISDKSLTQCTFY